MNELSHLGPGGARMVDVGGKTATRRRAVAEAVVALSPAHRAALAENPKGGVAGVVELAGVAAAKRCAELIPLCHQIPLTHVEVEMVETDDGLRITASVEATWVTGVEMEAYVAAAIAGLAAIDMLKSAGPDLSLAGVRLLEKRGGKSEFRREGR